MKTLIESLEKIYQNISEYPIPKENKLTRLILRVSKETEELLNEKLREEFNAPVNKFLPYDNSVFLNDYISGYELRHFDEKDNSTAGTVVVMFKSFEIHFSFNPSVEQVIEFA